MKRSVRRLRVDYPFAWMLADKAWRTCSKCRFREAADPAVHGSRGLLGRRPERHRRPVRQRAGSGGDVQRQLPTVGRAGPELFVPLARRRHRPLPAGHRGSPAEAAPSSRTTPSCCRGAWTTARGCGSRRPPAMARPMPSGGTADDVLRHHDPACARFRVQGGPYSTPDPPAGRRKGIAASRGATSACIPTSAR